MITKLIDVLFPKECVASGEKGDFLSKKEQRKLYMHPECCPGCKKNSPGFVYCHECRQISFLQGCVIGFIYKGAIKKLLLKLKYHHRYGVIEYLSQRLALHILSQESLAQRIYEGKLVITSIPSHRRRKYFVKGYNQSELLAKATAKALNVHYYSLISKNRHTKSQVSLGKAKRKANLSNCFTMKKGVSNEIEKGTDILIIDDMITTGATLQECAYTLQKSGIGDTIWGAVLARNAS